MSINIGRLAAQPTPNIGDVSNDSPGYYLVWSDEFDGTGAINTGNWFHQTQLPDGQNWFNGEVQHYTNRTANASVADGNLSITAIKESFTDQGVTKQYTSARLNSKYAFTYGRVDVRAKLPQEMGTWPAIWMLGQSINEDGGYWDGGAGETAGSVNWPLVGEIDILEQFTNKNEVTSAIHNQQSFGNTENKGSLALGTSTTGFHTYSIIWNENEIQFLVDNEEYWTYNPITKYGVKNVNTWPFDEPQYLLLNIAMGGGGGAIPAEFSSATMEIDYVRVYQSDNSNTGGGDSFDGGLLVNGDFEDGSTSWINNVDVRTEGGNSYNFANVVTAGTPFSVNLSQVVSITQGTDYILTFDASTGTGTTRTMLAGIGLNQDPWTNVTETINLTDQTQTFTLNLSATDFGGANSRVIFDMGADVGVVVIDNVSLVVNEGTSTGGGDRANGPELVVNGGFETGTTQTDWELLDQGGSITITDTEKRDGTYAALIVADVANLGIPASFPVMNQSNFGASAVNPGDQVRVTFDIKAISGTEAPVYKAALFSNFTGSGAFRHDINFPAITGEWQTVTADFTTDGALDPANGLSIQFQVDCGANPNCSAEVYIDNVSVFVLGNIDTQRPVITLTGGSSVDLAIGTPYVEPGFTATDNIDGDITANVVVIGGETVDENTEGTYEIRYRVSDAAGNAAIEVTRIVTVGAGGEDVGPSLIANGGFETGDLTDWVSNIQGGTIAVIDTDKNGGTYSVQVKADVDGNSGSPSFPVLESAPFAQNEVNPGDKVKVTFDIKGAIAGAGGVPKTALFSNKADGQGAVRHEITLPEFTGAWQTVTVDITTDASLDVNNGLTLQFQADCGGVAGCVVDMLIDNISVSLVESGGGGEGGASAPVVSAPTPPAREAGDVLGIYGDAYSVVSGINYNPNWGQSGHNDLDASYDPGDGNLALAYANFTFQGTELPAQDLSAMEYFHVDIWVPSGTDRLVKFSPINNGTGAGEFLVEVPLTPGTWNSVDLAKADFTGMTWDNVFQLKFDGQFNGDGSVNTTPFDVYLDNMYFYKEVLTEPAVAATAPTEASSDVISMFSDSYTSVTVNTWRTDWSVGALEDVTIGGSAMKKYTAVNFIGVETTGANLIDASQMTHLHVDLWTPDATQFRLKLVDFGADKGFAGGDDSEQELTFANLAQGEWISFDIPFTEFTGLTNRDNLAQMIFSAQPAGAATLFIDNVYFYKKAPSLSLPITFDIAGLDYEAKETGNVNFTVIDNPEQSGINASLTKVGQITNAGLNWENAYFNLDDPIDFSTEKRVTLKLYSTQALPIKLKFENLPADNVEADANHEGTGWEELVFDFNSSSSFENMVLFVDGPGTAAGTFYIDDIVQDQTPPKSNGPELIVDGDFEVGTSQTAWTVLTNDGTVEITDTDQNGGTYSAKLVADVPGTTASFPLIEQQGFGLDAVNQGDVVRVDFYVKAIVTQPGADVKAALFSNKVDGQGASRYDISFTPTGEWQFVTADITIDNLFVPANGLSIQFQASCGGVNGCNIEMYVDNVSAFVLGNVDTQRPVITLTGGSPYSLASGTPYSEPGYAASDNIDGDISANVVVSGDVVDENVDGSYELRYNVSDAEGNDAIQVTRIVNVGAGGGGGGTDVGPSLIPNGGFEDGIAQTDWDFLTNNGTIEITDTDKNGGVYAAKLVAAVPAAPAPATASNPIIQQEGFALDAVNIGDVVRVSFDVKTTTSGDGGVPKAALLSNKADGQGASRYDINFTPTGNWQTVSEDITIDNLFVSANGLSIQFEAGCGGVNGCGVEMLIDNVSVSKVDGGGTGGVSTVKLPLDFELSSELYTFGSFGDAVFEVAVDPTDASNNALKMTRPANTAWWSGGTITLDEAVDATTGTFSMDVYSSIALGYVELKFEQDANNSMVMNTTHGGSGWETLTFETSTGALTGTPSAATLAVVTPRITNDNTVATNPTAAEIYYFDNIEAGGSVVSTVKLPLDFELSSELYTFGPFGNAAFEIVADPDDAGNTALKMTRASGTDWWSGGTITLDEAVDATTGTFSMDVYSSIALGYVELKFEQDANNSMVMNTTHGGSGWETLTFETSTGALTGTPSAATLAVVTPRITNDNTVATNPTSAEIYYFDNLRIGSDTGGGDPGPATELAENGDFEAGDLSGWAVYANNGSIIADNTLNNGGSWSGKLVAGPTNNPTLKQEGKGAGLVAAGDQIKVSFDYQGSAADGGVFDFQAFVEGGGVNQTENFTSSITPTNTWQTFTNTFTVGNVDASGGITLQFGAICGGATTCNSTLSLDNVSIEILGDGDGGGTTCVAEAAQNIDPAQGAINWTFKDGQGAFEAFEGISGSVVDNPYIDEANGSCKVYKIDKTTGCQTWSGIGKTLTSAINFDNSTTDEIRLKVYAETEATSITVMLENLPFPNNSVTVPVTKTISGTGQWEELVFDFSGNDGQDFTSIIIYAERDAACDGDVYYIDDIEVDLMAPGNGGGGDPGSATELAENGDFETGDLTGWIAVPNGGTATIDNVVNNGGSYSGKLVAAMGNNPVFKQERKGAGMVSEGDQITISFDYLGGLSGDGGVFDFRAFVEIDGGGVSQTEVFSGIVPTATWQTFTQTFTIGNVNASGGITLQINAICGGVEGCGATLNIDNVSIRIGGADDGGGGEVATVGLPLDFELSPELYNLQIFGDAVFEIASDPIEAGNNVLKMTRPAGTQWWSGGTIALEEAVDATTGTFSMDVYSTIALGYVELKFEQDAGNSMVMNTTHGGTGWETLTFETTSGAKTGNPSAATLAVVTPRITNVQGVNPSTSEIYYFDNLKVGGDEGNSITLPLHFESGIATEDFIDFDGGQVTIVPNPDVNEINTSATVAKMVKSTDQTWGGSSLILSGPIDFSTNKTFKMKVWAPRVGARVLLKVENSSDPTINFEREIATTVANTWEELTFDYTAINTAASFDKLVWIFENGTMGDGSENFTFYFDDLELVEGEPLNLPNLPLDFESEELVYDLTEFEGSPSVVINNPFAINGNTSAKVVQTTKAQGAATFAGTILPLADPIDFSTGSIIQMKVYAPKTMTIRLQLENAGNSAIQQRVDVTNTQINQWETLQFDFSRLVTTQELSRMVLFFDFEVAGDGSVYYWDDVELVGEPIIPPSFPVDFESTAFTYNFLDFEGQGSAVVSNPDPNGANTSATVVQTNKGAGAATFAGTIIGFNAPIDFTEGKVLSLKTWSPKVGATVNLKLENRDVAAIGAEVAAVTTVANQWEELTFDFTGLIEEKSLSKAIVFFDFGQTGGATETTYYWDELQIRPIPNEENATLSNIFVDGVPIASFDPEVREYRVVLPEGTTAVPTITVEKDFFGANAVITEASDLLGKTTIAVTSQDGNTTLTYEVGFTLLTSTNNIVVNGGFENGASPWTTNYGNNTPDIQTDGGNSFFQADVATAGNAFAVNLSQALTIDQFKTYILSFDASTGAGTSRKMVAGIGLNVEPFTNNTRQVTLTDQTQTFTLILSADNFGGANSRVLFDMGADVGVVVIDNVSLIERVVPPVLPTDGPAAPSYLAEEVVSVFSDSYADITNVGFNDQGEAGFERIDLNGNEVLKYTRTEVEGGTFSIIELGEANQVDMLASGVSNLRFDMWFPNEVTPGSSLIFKVVDIGSPVSEAFIRINDAFSPAMTQGGWITFDFSIADLTGFGMGGFSNIQQFVLDVRDAPEVYIDNLIFYRAEINPLSDASLSDLTVAGTTVAGFSPLVTNYTVELPIGSQIPEVLATTTNTNADAVVSPAALLPGATTVLVTAEDGQTTSTYTIDFILVDPPTSAPAAPTEDAAGVFSVFSDSYDDVPKIGFNEIGGSEFEIVNLDGNSVLRYAIGANNFNIIDMGPDNKIDLSAKGITNFQFDVWFSKTLDAESSFLFKINDGTTTNEAIVTLNAASDPAITQGQWLTYDFTLPELGLSANTNIQQIVIDVLNVGEAYFDNIYFYNSGQDVSNLLTNGDFEQGQTGWRTSYEGGPEIQQSEGNSFFFANIETPNPSQPFAANLDQVLNLTTGQSYVLSFDASSGVGQNRSLQVGIGQNFGSFVSSIADVELSSPGSNGELASFSVVLTANFEVGASNRVFFNLAGDAGVVIIDNVRLELAAPATFPVIFDDNQAYTFGEFGGSPSVVAANPSSGGLNTSAQVGQTTKVVGGTPTAGTVLELSQPIDFSQSKTISMKVFSPKSGMTVKLRLENSSNSNIGFEVDAVNSSVNQWEVLEFDFSEVTTESLSKIVLFFDFDQPADGSIYYWDDLTFASDADATLSDLRIGDATVQNFDPAILQYTVMLPFGTTEVPQVTVTPNDINANALITHAEALPGTTSILVTAQDNSTTKTYTVVFTIAEPSTVATLSGINVSDVAITEFDAATLIYTVELPFGTTVNPVVTATATDDKASVSVTQAASVSGTATILVTAEDGSTQNTYTINFSVAAAGNIATLSDLRLNGNTITSFASETFSYNVALPSGSTLQDIPVITVSPTDAAATFVINNATVLPGQATIEVTAQDQSTVQTYSIQFTIAGAAQDASLSDLKYDIDPQDNIEAVAVEGFSPVTLTYNVELPFGTSNTAIPIVTATASYIGSASPDDGAKVTITPANELPGATTILVVSEDGTQQQTYTINFTIAAPGTEATLSNLTVNGTAISGFNAETLVYNITLPAGTTVVPTIVATPTDDKAQVEVTASAELPSATRIVVTAEDDTNTTTYTVFFKVTGDPNLLTNGNFESGTEAWTTNFGGPEIRTESGNSYFYAEVTAAGQSFNVNMSQVLTLTAGQFYVLSFDASTGAGNTRSMIAGIGQNFGSFTSSTQQISLTGNSRRYTMVLPASFQAGENSRVFFDMGADVGVVVIDNVQLTLARPMTFPVNFEANNVAYSFSEFNGAPAVLADNPSRVDANTSAKVAKTTKSGTEGAGTILTLSEPINFSQNKILGLKVYSPKSGMTVRLKLENATNPDVFVEKDAVTSVANSWEELEFNFIEDITNQSLSKVILIFDVGNAGDGTEYFWDDLDYKLNNSFLSDLRVDNATVEGFAADKLEYEIQLPSNAATFPQVTATSVDPNAVVEFSLATINLTNPTPEDSITTVTVTAADGVSRSVYTVKFRKAASETDATLANITVNGIALENFSATTVNYDVLLPAGTTNVPAIEVLTSNPNATATITNPEALPGSTTIIVTATDEQTTRTYRLNFRVISSDATLSDLKVGGETIENFGSDVTSYDVELPFGTVVADIPIVSGTVTSEFATLEITPAQSLPGNTVIRVTAEDGTTIANYTVAFKLAAPDTDATLSAIKINNVSIANFDPEVVQYTVELPIGTTSAPTVTATARSNKASVTISAVTQTSGTVTIVVTAQDGTTTKTYTVAYAVKIASSDATLADLLVDGITILGFDPAKTEYTVMLPLGSTVVPNISAVLSDENATITISQAENLNGNTVIEVTAENGVKQLYTIVFEVTENQKPVLLSPMLDQVILVSNTITLDLSLNFSDPENAELTYSFTNLNDELVAISLEDDKLSITGLNVGSTTIEVTAKDDINSTVSESFTVTVVANEDELFFDVSGRVTAGGAVFTEGVAVLLDENNINNVFTTALFSNGGFAFSFLPKGNYFLYVSSTSPDFVTTLFGNLSYVVDVNATPIPLEVNKNITGANIAMVQSPTSVIQFLDESTGGMIHFNSRSVTGGGSRILQSQQLEGDILPGVMVVLRTQQGGYVADGVTDSNGYIRFAGLPTGDYNLTVFVPGIGSVSASASIVQGRQFYFAGLIDQDNIAINVVTSVTDPLSHIKLYPSNVDSELYLEIPYLHSIGHFDLNIISMSGQVISLKTSFVDSKLIINVNQLNSGVYIIRIINDEGMWTGKFIKK